jgi:hypothetical protein
MPEDSWWDTHGFPVLDQIPAKRPVSDLLGLPLVLVTGEPWIGKTYVSEQLAAAVVGKRFRDRRKSTSSTLAKQRLARLKNP